MKRNIQGQIVGSGETITKVTDNGYILLSRDNCPYLYKSSTKRAFKLCDHGISVAYDVNRQGKVVGSSVENGLLTPVTWSAKEGSRELPLLAGYTEGAAFGINDRGEVVGYNSATTNVPAPSWYYDDGNGNEVCDEDTEGPCTLLVRTPTAFRYDSKRGSREAINDPAHRATVAVDIDNNGNIAGWIAVRVEDTYLSLTPGLQSVDRAHNFKGKVSELADEPTYHYVNTLVDDRDLPPFSEALQLSLNERKILAFDTHLFNFTSRRPKISPVAPLFTGGRSDFGSGIKVSNGKLIIGNRTGTPFLQTPGRQETALSCLVPQNHSIRGLNVTVEKLDFTSDPFFQGEDILIQANIIGDNREDRPLFRFKRLNRDKFGAYYSFCPEVKLLNRCKKTSGELVGRWRTEFKETLYLGYNISRGRYVEDHYVYLNGNNEWLADSNETIQDGERCELTLGVTSGFIPLSGATVSLNSIDTAGPLGKSCTVRQGESHKTDQGGVSPLFSYEARAEIDRLATVKIFDRRFKTAGQETQILIHEGDGSIPSSSSCD